MRPAFAWMAIGAVGLVSILSGAPTAFVWLWTAILLVVFIAAKLFGLYSPEGRKSIRRELIAVSALLLLMLAFQKVGGYNTITFETRQQTVLFGLPLVEHTFESGTTKKLKPKELGIFSEDEISKAWVDDYRYPLVDYIILNAITLWHPGNRSMRRELSNHLSFVPDELIERLSRAEKMVIIEEFGDMLRRKSVDTYAWERIYSREMEIGEGGRSLTTGKDGQEKED